MLRTLAILLIRPARQTVELAYTAAPRGPYASDTGEVRWDAQAGQVTVQAPQVEAAVGFVGGRDVALAHMALRASTRFAAVSLVSRDGRTRVLNYGYAPVRGELVSARIRLCVGEIEVFALSSDGRRGPRVHTRRDRDAGVIDVSPRWRTLWYEIVRKK